MSAAAAAPRATRWLEGRGLHGGRAARARIVSSDNVPGVAIRRVDLPGDQTIPATLGSVAVAHDAYSTTLLDAAGDVYARTIEHVMSALAGTGAMQGVLVELDGDELPCLDGASLAWVDALVDAGLAAEGPLLASIDEPFVFERDGRSLAITPSEQLAVDVEVDFDPPIGAQRAAWAGTAVAYREDVAPARTFATSREAERILSHGLALGIHPGAAVVYASSGPLTPPRWSNEPARHKLLDLVGDLALLGALPRAHVVARRPGHAFVVAALRELVGRPRAS